MVASPKSAEDRKMLFCNAPKYYMNLKYSIEDLVYVYIEKVVVSVSECTIKEKIFLLDTCRSLGFYPKW